MIKLQHLFKQIYIFSFIRILDNKYCKEIESAY